MFTPFGMNRTTLGLAAIQAQDESYPLPADNALLTGRQWIEGYLRPLARPICLAITCDSIRRSSPLAKWNCSKLTCQGRWTAATGHFACSHAMQTAAGRVEVVDGVLDCTGVFANANWLGHGGIPAIGETSLRNQIEYRLPDILGPDRGRDNSNRVGSFTNNYIEIETDAIIAYALDLNHRNTAKSPPVGTSAVRSFRCVEFRQHFAFFHSLM